MFDPAWIGFGLNVAVVLGGATWGISKIKSTVANEISDHKEQVAAALVKVESRLAQTVAESVRELEERQDAATRMFGESVAAVREQMHIKEKESLKGLFDISERLGSVEKWARDEFVRKESFREVCSRIENVVAEQGRNMNAALQSMTNTLMSLATAGKIDKA